MALKNSPGIGIPGSILHDPISTTEVGLRSQLSFARLPYYVPLSRRCICPSHERTGARFIAPLKVATLMNDFGLSETAWISVPSIRDLLRKTFIRLVANREGIKARMARQ